MVHSEDKGVMDSIINELFNNAEHNPDDKNGARPHFDLSVKLDAANIAHDSEGKDDDDNEEDDDLDNGNLQEEVGSDDIIVATINIPSKFQWEMLRICVSRISTLKEGQ